MVSLFIVDSHAVVVTNLVIHALYPYTYMCIFYFPSTYISLSVLTLFLQVKCTCCSEITSKEVCLSLVEIIPFSNTIIGHMINKLISSSSFLFLFFNSQENIIKTKFKRGKTNTPKAGFQEGSLKNRKKRNKKFEPKPTVHAIYKITLNEAGWGRVRYPSIPDRDEFWPFVGDPK